MPEGWNAEDRILTVAPGRTVAEVQLSREEGAPEGKGTIRFVSEGEELSEEFGTSDRGVLAGFFGLGEGFAIGLILVVILILVIPLLSKGREVSREEELAKWENELN